MSKFGEWLDANKDLPLKKVTVEAWEKDLYFYPCTVNGQKKIIDLAKRSGGSNQDEWVYYLICEARDEQGDLIFDLNDKATLMNQPAEVILDIWLQAQAPEKYPEPTTDIEKKRPRSKRQPSK